MHRVSPSHSNTCLPRSLYADVPVGKISIVAFSVIFMGLGVAAYFYGPQFLPQFFATSISRIAISAGLAGVGVLLNIGLLIHCCIRHNQKRVENSVKPMPVPNRNPSRLICYQCDQAGRLHITLGFANLEKLCRGEHVDVPAVTIERTPLNVKMRAVNGFLWQKSSPEHFAFLEPDIATMSAKKECTLVIDSIENPVILFFCGKIINTWVSAVQGQA